MHMTKSLLISFSYLVFAITSYPQSDTINIYLDSTDCAVKPLQYDIRGIRPYRIISAGKNNGGFIDSVRICNHAIQIDTSDYYLIVYTQDSTKLLEGQFYGRHTNGIIKEYDRWGRIIFEGMNRYQDPDKYNSYAYSTPVGINITYTYKNRNSTQPKLTKKVIYKPKSKKYTIQLYDAKGQLINETKGKR